MSLTAEGDIAASSRKITVERPQSARNGHVSVSNLSLFYATISKFMEVRENGEHGRRR